MFDVTMQDSIDTACKVLDSLGRGWGRGLGLGEGQIRKLEEGPRTKVLTGWCGHRYTLHARMSDHLRPVVTMEFRTHSGVGSVTLTACGPHVMARVEPAWESLCSLYGDFPSPNGSPWHEYTSTARIRQPVLELLAELERAILGNAASWRDVGVAIGGTAESIERWTRERSALQSLVPMSN